MEKKINVEVNGRIVRVMKHCIDDVISLGGSTMPKVVKNPPKELLLDKTKLPDTIDISKDVLPKMTTSKSEIDIVKEKLTEMGIKFHPNTGLEKLKAKLDVGNKE